MMGVGEFCVLIQSLVEAHPRVRVSSWARGRQANLALVGAVSDSLHLRGLAVDVVGEGLVEFGRACEELGLRVLVYSTHLHVDVGRDAV